MNLPTATTSIVAWYAAIVSTAGLLLALFVARRDRRRATLSVRRDMVVPTDNFAFEERYVTVTVANSGRRPLTITGVGFLRKTRSAGELLINESIKNGPTDIPEGKSHTFLIAQSSLPLDDIRKVIARDALGNVWKRKVKF